MTDFNELFEREKAKELESLEVAAVIPLHQKPLTIEPDEESFSSKLHSCT